MPLTGPRNVDAVEKPEERTGDVVVVEEDLKRRGRKDASEEKRSLGLGFIF